MVIKKIDYVSSQHFSCDITPKRITQKYELEIYIGGNGISYIDGKSYSHSEHKVIFAKPGQERFSTGEFHCYALHFDCKDPDIARVLQSIPDCSIVDSKVKGSMIERYEVVDASQRIPAFAALFQILALLNGGSTVVSNYDSVPIPEVSFVKDYIDEHFTQRIDIMALAEQVYLSPNYLRKKFLESFGITVQKYIIDMRLGLVKKLLLTSNKPLSEIAYCAGFNSQSHMNVMFRSAFGITPLEYKKQSYTQECHIP